MPTALLFHANPSSGVPLYRQIIDQVRLMIASGRLRSGDFLPSVRQVAQELQINPMTVSRAYSELERDGTVELVRGTGMRILPVQAIGTLRERQREMAPLLQQVVASARQLNISPTQVLSQLGALLLEHDHA